MGSWVSFDSVENAIAHCYGYVPMTGDAYDVFPRYVWQNGIPLSNIADGTAIYPPKLKDIVSDEYDYGTTYPAPELKGLVSAFDRQILGNHYKELGIQPVEYIMANGLGFCEGNCIKYVTRYKSKGGIDDLRKARHYLDMLIETLEKNNNKGQSY